MRVLAWRQPARMRTRCRQRLRGAAVGHGLAAAAAAPDLCLCHGAARHPVPAQGLKFRGTTAHQICTIQESTSAVCGAADEGTQAAFHIHGIHKAAACSSTSEAETVHCTAVSNTFHLSKYDAVHCCAAHLCRGDGLAAPPPPLPLSRRFALVPLPPAGGAEQLRYMETPSDALRTPPLAAAAAAAGLELAAAGLPLRAGSFAARLCVAAASSSVLTAVLAGGCACSL